MIWQFKRRPSSLPSGVLEVAVLVEAETRELALQKILKDCFPGCPPSEWVPRFTPLELR